MKSLVDFQTVQHIELCCPGISQTDKDFLTQAMADKALFPMVTDRMLRSQISMNLQSIQYVIPSLRTFFEDTKWLEPCAKIMRTLVDPGTKESIQRSFKRTHEGVETGHLRIQTSDVRFLTRQGSEDEIFITGYRQLWLFAWRHFPQLSTILPRKDAGKPKPRERATNDIYDRFLARLALDFGFSSTTLRTLAGQDSDERMIREFVSQARPSHLYDLNDAAIESCIRAIWDILAAVRQRNEDTAPLAISPPDQEVSRGHRCGRPHESSCNDSKPRFFFEQIYGPACTVVSHFSINRDIFRAFFGSQAYNGSRVTAPRATQMDVPSWIADSTYTFALQRPDIRPRGHAPEPSRPAHNRTPLPPVPELNTVSTDPPEHDTGLETQSVAVLDIADLDDDFAEPEGTGSAGTTIGTTNEPPAPPAQPPTPVIASQAAAASTALVKLGPPSLYKHWQHSCADGDICFILPAKKLVTSEEFGAKDDDYVVREVAKSATDFYFAVYNSDAKRLVSIKADDIPRFRKSQTQDGIVYTFLHRLTLHSNLYDFWHVGLSAEDLQFSMSIIKGETTEERLTSIENWHAKKRKFEPDRGKRVILKGKEIDIDKGRRMKRRDETPGDAEWAPSPEL